MTVEHHIFGSDRPLLYDVEPWNRLGFAVANFGNDLGTISRPIWGLADEIGRAQLFLMTHIDAQRTQPPSINTVRRIGALCNRVNSVLGGRKKSYSKLRLEEGHASSGLHRWIIHPVPFFTSAIVRNHWMAEYNDLVMIALTNMYQHSDNNLALTVTEKFATDVWQYIREIKVLMGSELLLLNPDDVVKDEFLFTDEHYAAYAPDRVTGNYEALDRPGPIQSRSTEDDLRPLFEGIPANIIAPLLRQYPVVDDADMSGAPLPEEASAPGTADGSAIAGAGRPIGEPSV
jgi:hypothetical protein